MKKIKIFIDNKEIITEEGLNLLQVALDHDIHIPHFCFHEDLSIKGNCRICIVENETTGKIIFSCTVKTEDNLKILTNSPKVQELRKINLELLLSGHKENCPKCKNNLQCKIGDLIREYGIVGNKFKKENIAGDLIKMDPSIELDQNMCINCRNCEEMCEKIGIGYLQSKGKGYKSAMGITENKNIECINCGQCTVHCPTGAIREQEQIKDVEKILKEKNKIIIAQCAPSVRVSIGEEFGFTPGTNVEGKIFTALRKLGFNKIFDVNMGADITTIVEAEELIERIKDNKNLPMFTSCCPAWVKFVEYYHPELIPNLTTARSPHIHSGGAYKTWWANKEKINPKDVIVISIMPCTAKKLEISLEKFNIDGIKPVDFVLTARELVSLFKKNKIDLSNLQDSELDIPGTYSGAGVIYGASGGVMESALRTAHKIITGKDLKNLELQEVRGIQGIKKAKIKIGKKTLKVGIASTPKNAKIIIDEIKKDPKSYDYIEIMACPGGCIGGGGQPIPTNSRIISKRKEGIYKIDNKKKLRTAHDNPIVKDFFEYIGSLNKHKKHKILHTEYHKFKKRGLIKSIINKIKNINK